MTTAFRHTHAMKTPEKKSLRANRNVPRKEGHNL